MLHNPKVGDWIILTDYYAPNKIPLYTIGKIVSIYPSVYHPGLIYINSADKGADASRFDPIELTELEKLLYDKSIPKEGL